MATHSAPMRSNGGTSIRRRSGTAGEPNDIAEGASPCPLPPRSPLPSGTPRSTLGSPLTTHATARRSGDGDVAAGPRRHNSLSEVNLLAWLCCMTPALCIFFIYGAVLVTSLFFSSASYLITAALTVITCAWIDLNCLSAMYGAYCLRKETKKDWHPMLEQVMESDPDTNDVLHIVMLPNYKENERMLKDTLETIGLSPIARSRVRVVLAMEAREGPSGQEKADRLIRETQHLFADMFATYHPEGLPGEVPGKSSNVQWAFREALRHYGPILLCCDLSRVFLTVGDADTLFHPQYLSALTYSGLTMSAEERVWRIWQPPVILARNLFTVPAMTRASSHATLIFELGTLGSQAVFPAFAYSAYSMSLALASHPEVDGWDVDVIAEDHHMYCKTYFAALWELAHAGKDALNKSGVNEIAIKPQLKVEPIFLPAVSYLVESSEGYWASMRARWNQARRHMQGVVELGYVLLQYTRLASNVGYFTIPFRTHVGIISIAAKIHLVHITATAQCFALIMSVVTAVRAGGIAWIMEQANLGLMFHVNESISALGFSQRALMNAVTSGSWVYVLYTFVVFFVIRDLMEGTYYQVLGVSRQMPPVKEESEDAAEEVSCHSEEESDNPSSSSAHAPARCSGVPSFVLGKLSFSRAVSVFLTIFYDTAIIGYPSIVVWALIPELLAAYSLFRRGTDFEYIVAAKPE